ncbi:hypothetical protein SAMN04487952_1057 [Halomonas caseinilytica]|nr:hypothetical protein SAMN04487952_1057 [Halomonas caseinilytica]
MTNRHAFVIHEHPPSVVINEGEQSWEMRPLWLRERQVLEQLHEKTPRAKHCSRAPRCAFVSSMPGPNWSHRTMIQADDDGHRG